MLEEKLKFINEVIPTKIYNTMSSTAGAGSGDFHMYRLVGFTSSPPPPTPPLLPLVGRAGDDGPRPAAALGAVRGHPP